MKTYKLKATTRTQIGKKVKKLRKEGNLPATVYGKDFKSQSVQVNLKEFQEVYKQAGETGIVELGLDKEILPILIHNIHYHPTTAQPLHADFYKVNLKEKVSASIPLVVINEAPAVINKIGVLLNILSEVAVEALPADLPEKIEVDVAGLTEINSTIKVADLKVSDKVTIKTDGALEIVKIAPLVSKEAEKQAKEEEAAKAEAAAQQTATEGAETAPKAGEEAPGEKSTASAASASTEKTS
ncbi:50S ribosomal protein L25 [Candidatus Gottesmanbacteria bacterium]|nr:50S ribosomal protein L25 [Candidatus Gottesmanbacteria bacterium]